MILVAPLQRALVACVLLGLTGPACATGPGPATPVARKAEWWQARNARIQARIQRGLQRGGVDLIFVGDSITAGWEGRGKAEWQRHYGRRKAVNMGINGDETGHVLWRLGRGSLRLTSPRVAVVLIGVNNVYRRGHSAARIAAGVKAVVGLLGKLLPRTKVLLLAIFPAGQWPGRLRDKIGAVNSRIAELADGKRVHYLDIGDKLVGRAGQISHRVMFDHLHLTEKGYRIWAAAMEPTLRRLLGEK